MMKMKEGRMKMGKKFYKLAGATVRLFSHKMKTEWEVPFEDGPCVFVVNHAGSSGPVDMCAKFPLRDKIHPWVNSEMLSAKEVPAYVRKSFWWKPARRKGNRLRPNSRWNERSAMPIPVP